MIFSLHRELYHFDTENARHTTLCGENHGNVMYLIVRSQVCNVVRFDGTLKLISREIDR